MYKLKSKVLFAALVVSTVFGSSSFVAQNTGESKLVTARVNSPMFSKVNTEKDAEFLVVASELLMEEINLGKLAHEKGRMSHVKDLGKKMQDDHTKSLAELKTLAKSKNISLPTSPTEDANKYYKDLNDKSGNEFDKTYIDMMVNDHKNAIKIFEKASTDSDDYDIKTWALNTLPTLRVHHDHSKVCQKELDKM